MIPSPTLGSVSTCRPLKPRCCFKTGAKPRATLATSAFIFGGNRIFMTRACTVRLLLLSQRRAVTLDPDVRGYVSPRVAHLVGAGGAGWFLAKVHVEVFVDLHAAILGIAVDLEQVGTFLGQLGVKLVVPTAIERVGYVEALAIERELEHLRAALKASPRRLLALAEQTSTPDLAGEARVGGIAYIVLAEVAVEPVGEVEEAVVHGDEEVGDQARYRHRPALDVFWGHVYDLLGLPVAVLLVPV